MHPLCRQDRPTIPALLGRALPLVATLLSLFAAGLDPGAAQATSPPTPPAGTNLPIPSFAEAVSVSWVLVPVAIRTRDGYAQGLDRRDFRLWVDDRRVPIDELDLGSDAPLTVVWLQDLSGSMANAGKLDASRLALGAFLHGMRPGDQIALATFAGGTTHVEVPFTGESATLREAADLWKGYGTTALHDAVALLPKLSAEGTRGKRVAILVTDGQDNASQLSPAKVVELIRGARLPVYVLGLRSPGAPEPSTTEGAAGAMRYAEILRDLARETGGLYSDLESPHPTGPRVAGSEPEHSTEITLTVEAILEHLRQRYILGFTTAGDGRKSYHRLRVETAFPGRHAPSDRPASLTYRRGYFGTEPLALRGTGTASGGN